MVEIRNILLFCIALPATRYYQCNHARNDYYLFYLISFFNSINRMIEKP